MEKFNNLKSIPSYLSLQNIDTDMIIPKQFLKTIKRTGLGKSLFYEMRYDENGNKIPERVAKHFSVYRNRFGYGTPQSCKYCSLVRWSSLSS